MERKQEPLNELMPKIGIVVPVYKVKDTYLFECVNSLTKQTYENIEIVLVDDFSPDNCGHICEQLAKIDSRIKVVHHERNRGLPSARNTGLDHLSTDCRWVTFVDSDDWLELDACEKFVAYLNKWNQQPDMVIFSGCKNYPDHEMISAPAFQNETWFKGRGAINQLQQTSLKYVQKQFPVNSINLDSACWRFVSLDFLNAHQIRFVDVPYREDGLFFLHTTEHAEKIVYIYEPFYHYRSTGNSMVNMYRKHADEEHRIYLQEVWNFIVKYEKDQAFIDSAFYAVLLSMEICISQKFFNANNPDSLKVKHKECNKYFSEMPYSEVFKKIDLKTLRRNHRIKAEMIKHHWYYGSVMLRELYNKVNRKNQYE